MMAAQFLAVLVAMIGLLACSPQGSNSSGSGGGSGSTATTTTSTSTTIPISATQPLTLQITTNWSGTTSQYYHTFTETGTTLCQATTTAPNAVCSVAIPEARLYYSDINFVFSWLNTNTACKLLTFQPYYYKSSAVSFSPPWGNPATPTDCTLADTPADCWGGAARYLVPSFPKFRGLIYFPDESVTSGPQQKTVTLSSAYSKKYYTNRLASNDLPLVKRATNFSSAQLGGYGDPYIANTYVDYEFSCQDEWYDVINYTISLNITDADSSSGAVNDFLSWRDAP